MKFVMDTDRCF